MITTEGWGDGATGILWVEARVAAEHHTCTGQSPWHRTGPNVNSGRLTNAAPEPPTLSVVVSCHWLPTGVTTGPALSATLSERVYKPW